MVFINFYGILSGVRHNEISKLFQRKKERAGLYAKVDLCLPRNNQGRGENSEMGGKENKQLPLFKLISYNCS